MSVTAQTAGLLASLRALQSGITLAAEQSVQAAVAAATASAKSTTLFKDRTGATRASITGSVVGLNGFVRAGGASRWIEYGTSPHVITARSGKYLRFQAGGGTVFAKSVHHPGTTAKPFMAEASVAGQHIFVSVASHLVGTAVAKFNT